MKEDFYWILWPLKVTAHAVFFTTQYLKKEAGFMSGLL